MPVRNCCLGCQGPMGGPCGPISGRKECPGNYVGPLCVHSIGAFCSSPCGDRGVVHGYVIRSNLLVQEKLSMVKDNILFQPKGNIF